MTPQKVIDKLFYFSLFFLLSTTSLIIAIPQSLYNSFDSENFNYQDIEIKGDILELADAIFLALRYNEALQSAYWDREAQLFDLKVTENTFNPSGEISLGGNVRENYFRDNTFNRIWSLDQANLALRQNLKTGKNANIRFNWTNTNSWLKTASGDTSSASSSVSLSFTHPLLKGFGCKYGTLFLTNAYLSEESNVLSLKSTVIQTVNRVIRDYRGYILAIKQFEIDKRSVERAQQRFDNLKVEVEVGRKSEYSLLQNEGQLARAKQIFEDNLNTVDLARIRLLRTINIDIDEPIIPNMDINADISENLLPSLDTALTIAFANEPGYLQQLISERRSELNYMDACNNMLWDLSASGGISSNSSTNPSSFGSANQESWDFKNKTWNLGLRLSIPINDLSRKQTLIRSKVNLRKSRLSTQEREKNIRSGLKDSLRNIKSLMRSVQLAENATELTRKDFEGAKLKFSLGKTSSFELNSKEDTLVQQERSELSAKIALLNALTDLDRDLGTTLDTWQIDINRRLAQRPQLLRKNYATSMLAQDKS